jgi:dTDP-4-dehydrorhamnose 3,5-epimerase
MKFTPLDIPQVILIEPLVFSDDRGFFTETYQEQKFKSTGISTSFVQDNHSRSRRGVLRGMHYQINQPQGKLVRVVAGEIFDVAVDLRRSSPTFGNWVSTQLSAQNKLQIWIPPGLAHGFYVLSEWADLIYKTTDFYAPQDERTLLWNDPEIAIEWPLIGGLAPILSIKDAQGTPLRQADLFD